MPATTMPATVMPVTATPVLLTQSEEDSADDLPLSKYLRKFLHQEETEFPQQDFDVPEPQHVTEFPQQEVSEPHQLPPKKRPIPEEQPIQQQEPPKKIKYQYKAYTEID